MQRLFVDNPLELAGNLTLEGDKAHYLLHVLRMKIGEKLLLFNGYAGEFLAQAITLQKKSVVLQILAQTRPQSPRPALHYAFAPLKSARLDYMLQKAVEMGVGEITPVVTAYTQVQRLKEERLMANAIEAAEQCGVLNLPVINAAIAFAHFIAQCKETLVFCDEHAPKGSAMAALRGITNKICVLIGPEGGFSSQEREKLLAHPGVIRLSLGNTILRADTAAVAALALVNEAIY